MNTQPRLFEVERGPSKRELNRAECELLKAQFGIQTQSFHRTPGVCDWCALSMPAACKALSGYELTKEQKTDLFEMVAGYCRILDEVYGLLVDGFKTEYEAVKAAAEAAKHYFP